MKRAGEIFGNLAELVMLRPLRQMPVRSFDTFPNERADLRGEFHLFPCRLHAGTIDCRSPMRWSGVLLKPVCAAHIEDQVEPILQLLRHVYRLL
jgi:hypothetical protein